MQCAGFKVNEQEELSPQKRLQQIPSQSYNLREQLQERQ